MKSLWYIWFWLVKKYYARLSPEKVFTVLSKKMRGYLKRHGLHGLKGCLRRRFSLAKSGDEKLIIDFGNKRLEILTVDDDTGPCGVKSISLVEIGSPKNKILKVVQNRHWLW